MDLSFLKRIFRVRQVYWNMLPERADSADGRQHEFGLDRADGSNLTLATARV